MESVAPYTCRLDAGGRIVSCNQRLLQASGGAPEALIGRPFAEAVAERAQQGVIEDLFRSGSARRNLPGDVLESSFPSAEGTPRRHVRWFMAPFDTDTGSRGYLALGWDDSAQVQMERFLLRLARAVDVTHEPVVIANARGVAEYINPAFTETAGYFPGEIIGRSLSRIVAVPEDPSLIHGAMDTFRRGESWEGPLRMRRKDGTALTVQVRILPVRDSSRHTTHYIAIAHDLSQQQNLERQVEELQRLESLGTLANGLAHRFNNILAAVSGQTELLIMSCQDDALRKRAQRILDAALKGKEVVEQLTAFGRKNDPRPRPADLVPVLRNALNFVRAAQPRAVTVTDQLPAESPHVLANTSELHQVMVNLLTNALQAIGDKPGRIDVRMRTELRPLNEGTPTPVVVIEVEDSGPGVPPDILHRIFEPFFTTRSLADASGMGLATSHGIVTRHGGTIDCRNVHGSGALFTIVLPVHVAQAAADEPTPKTGGGSILLVDAAGYPLETGKRQLEELHYQVVALANMDAALEALRDPSVPIGLLLTCYKLSRNSGLDLARNARKLRPGLPVVLCANMTDTVDPHEAKAAGVAEILRKPLLIERLSTVLRELMPPAEQA